MLALFSCSLPVVTQIRASHRAGPPPPPSPLRYNNAFIFIVRIIQHFVPSSTCVELCTWYIDFRPLLGCNRARAPRLFGIPVYSEMPPEKLGQLRPICRVRTLKDALDRQTVTGTALRQAYYRPLPDGSSEYFDVVPPASATLLGSHLRKTGTFY